MLSCDLCDLFKNKRPIKQELSFGKFPIWCNHMILIYSNFGKKYIYIYSIFTNMSFEYSQELANDYEKLLEDDEGYDVIIHAGENENVKEIHAHSNILRIKSQYFRVAFSNELA